MIGRMLWLAACAVIFSSCSSYRTVQVDGKTPIYPFKFGQLPQAMEAITSTLEKYEDDFKALERKPGDRALGTATFGLMVDGASGRGGDGAEVDGYVLREKLKLSSRAKNSEKYLRTRELIDRMQGELMKRFNRIAEPVYVTEYVLD